MPSLAWGEITVTGEASVVHLLPADSRFTNQSTETESVNTMIRTSSPKSHFQIYNFYK